ncbi:MAG: rRNA cytosine-C5-methylase [Rikenellaceae bacterium]
MSEVKLPQLFVERVVQDLGQVQAEALFSALSTESPTSIRLNPYKVKEPIAQRPVGWSKYGFYLDERPSFTLDSDFHAGAYYVQEASSQFVGHILSERNIEGARVLDMCAAPGGKSTLYSTLVGLEGLVVANEINRSRASILADNARKWGLGNIVVCNSRSEHLAQFQSWFDIVAVDAPCSGEGMFRKMEGAIEEWSPSNVAMCAERQREILDNGWQSLKAGGVLIYSTCTFNRTENEEVLEHFMESYGDEVAPYDTVECDESWSVSCGQVGAFQTFRFFPHKIEGEGLFVAVATKSFDAGGKMRQPKSRKKIFSSIDRQSLLEVSKWVAQPELMVFLNVADSAIYGYYRAQAEAVKSLAESLTIIYSGVAMGQIFKGKLKPDPALALFHDLNCDVVSEVELDNSDILLYLRKQELSAELFAEGINIVSANGYTIGFVKRIGGRVNNIYPNSLRILK